MDAGDESVVKGANAVGCQKEDALAVFHCAEEAYATFVSIVTVFGTNFCKYKVSKKMIGLLDTRLFRVKS